MKKVEYLEGFTNCVYADAYIVVLETKEEFEKRKLNEKIEVEIFIGESVFQSDVQKHQIDAALKNNCVQFLT